MNTRQRIEAKAKSNREQALDAFMAKKAEIDAMLARLTALSDDHFETSPDEINGAMSAPSATTPACSGRSPTWPSTKASTPRKATRSRTAPRRRGGRGSGS